MIENFELEDSDIKALACGVIIQAVKDIQEKGMISTMGGADREGYKTRKKLLQDDAHIFLAGGEGLRAWCAVAGVDYDVVVKGCRKLKGKFKRPVYHLYKGGSDEHKRVRTAKG